MTNSKNARRGKEAERAALDAGDTSRPAAHALSDEAIRARAYQLYREREGRGGDATGDWLAAEREQREHIGTRAQPALGTVGHGRAR